MMEKKYKSPPVVEALCEFQFVPNEAWDITIPGMLYERIKDEFPIKQQQIGFGVRIVQPREGGMRERRMELASPPMQFFSNDKCSLVQVGQDLLTINHLKPYRTWEVFRPSILKVLGKYVDIANPKGFRQIGLRYINKIDFDEHRIEITDYFNYHPTIPNDLPQEHKTFQVTVDIPYEEERDLLRLTLATIIPEEPGVLSLVLDIGYSMVKPEGIGFKQVLNWLENAHLIVETAFEASITDKCRGLFEEVK